MATWAFREKKNNNNKNNKAESFCRLKFNVYINVNNRESPSARMKKKKGRPVSLEETSMFTDFLFSPTSPSSARDNDKNSGELNDR